ncbi:MAG TPA: hypothetical protein VGK58_04005 [Lacipirellulaceae bacterium]
MRQFGKLATAQHVVAVQVEPAEQCVEVALARAAHGPDRTTRPIPTPHPIRITTRTVRITARSIRITTRPIRITWPIAITTRIAVARLAVPRISPSLALGVRTAFSFRRASAAVFKQVAHFLAKSIETLAHLVPHRLPFFGIQPAIAIFIECPQNALSGRPTRTIAFATLFWRLREGGLS